MNQVVLASNAVVKRQACVSGSQFWPAVYNTVVKHRGYVRRLICDAYAPISLAKCLRKTYEKPSVSE